MVWQRLRRRASNAFRSEVRVVSRSPWRTVAFGSLVAMVVAAAAAFGYWLGTGVGALDRSYLASLELRYQASESRLSALTRELADLRLARNVDGQAARSLRETITDLRREIAALNEEVVFYKRLMVPDSEERGLKVAEFQLGPGEKDNQAVYHLLLTQVAERRDWLQGRVEMRVIGDRVDPAGELAEEVLPLTELSQPDDYPLRFRFRYFQDLAGTLTLPEGFTPRQVLIVATAAGSDPVERRFDWWLHEG